jgi:hypothetical protein
MAHFQMISISSCLSLQSNPLVRLDRPDVDTIVIEANLNNIHYFLVKIFGLKKL